MRFCENGGNNVLGIYKNKLDQKSKDEAYGEFQLFFHRLVCMSSVRIVPDPFHTWEQIQGDNPRQMAAGHTTTSATGAIEVGDALNCSHNAFKVLFFNKDQQALLTTDNFRYLLFFCDLGAGKYMLS